MIVLKNFIQYSNIAARIYTKKKTRLFYIQSQSMSQHQIKTDALAFKAVFKDVTDSISAHPDISALPDLEHWLKKCIAYNSNGGKAARGLSVVTAYETLEKPENITEESMRLARILGWCVEMFQANLIILDDIMDGSKTRRGQPCWYLVPEVGTSNAINDAILLYNGMLYVMKKHFGDRSNYAELLDTINGTMLNTAIGQFLDLKISAMETEQKLSSFTPEIHLSIIKYKTAYYSYDCPVRLGYLLAGKQLDEKFKKQVQHICLDLGILFQIQDDYLDCYGEESLTGKAATDIAQGKCSWPAVNALQRCSEKQQIVFRACYGSEEPAHIERIKRLYDQLQIPQLYKQVEKRYHDDILEKIEELPSQEWKMLLSQLLNVTFMRKK